MSESYEEKLEEKILKLEEELYLKNQNFEELAISALNIDFEGKIIDANKSAAAYNYTGKKSKSFEDMKKEILGKNIYELVKPEEKQKIINVIETLSNKKKKRSTDEFMLRQTNGKEFYAEVSTTIIYDLQNSPKYINCLIKDITKRKKLEEELKEKAQDNEDRNNRKTEFLGNYTHETRTPLNAIIGFSRLLNREDISEQEKKQFLQIVQREAEHLYQLMEDGADIARIESGKIKIEKKEFSIKEILQNETELFKTRIKNKNIEVILENHEDIKIYSDPLRIRQITSNLIKNAIKFTDEGYVRIECKQIENDIYISVQDTGSGIEKSQQEKVFQRYKQFKSNKKGVGGTGLGLNLVKGLTEVLGGQIYFESEYKKGSKFTVQIPTGEIQKQKNY